jgi:uncharacterized protein (DUF2235 family)
MSDVKRIALFLDGTWNTVQDNTNVWRMKSLCAVVADQVCYYSVGVGTQYGERLKGGMLGYGLDDEVIRAYEWLTENYSPNDRIFIFGFSRGAFTARSLAGFISKCGLLKPGSPVSLKQLYDRYRKGSAARTIRELKNVPAAQRTFEERWLLEYSMPIPIFFQGVYDSVGALGVPFGNVPLISRSNYSFLETDLRINEDRGFHALAIDEHREAFAPTLWKKTVRENTPSYPARPLDQLEQRWFVGAHGDVGGGYANGILAQIPLQWLMQKAQAHGLMWKDAINIDGDEAQGEIHDSFAAMAGGVYRACKFWRRYYRGIGAAPVVTGDQTTSTINESIDASVFDRCRSESKYRPRNLMAWANAHQQDVTGIHGSVRADDLSVVIPGSPASC